MIRVALVALLAVAAPAGAQERPRNISPELAVAVVGASALDLASTFSLLARCPTCYEANPIARPFVEAGAIPTAAFVLAGDVLVLWSARELRRRDVSWWWVPPALAVALHVGAAVLNETRFR